MGGAKREGSEIHKVVGSRRNRKTRYAILQNTLHLKKCRSGANKNRVKTGNKGCGKQKV